MCLNVIYLSWSYYKGSIDIFDTLSGFFFFKDVSILKKRKTEMLSMEDENDLLVKNVLLELYYK